MEKKKYIVTVRGVLKFTNGKKVEFGGFVPSDISDDEIKEKLKRKVISVFDDKISALVQSSNADQIDIVKKLQNENEILIKENNELKSEIESLKKAAKK